MRRFQTSPSMTSKHKPYEMVGRPSIYSSGPATSKSRSIKFIGALVASAIALYLIHGVFTPSDKVYGLMIDAGSTGSRIHTFTFQKHPETAQLKVLYEDFYAIKPGLSHYKDSPASAAASLDSLLTRAKTLVPAEQRSTTPVVLRATAGLRMVGEEIATAILKQVRTKLRTSGFRFDEDTWASILSGNEEAVYSWMTVNYLLGKHANDTVGVMEMGGGSAQIAYVPNDGSVKPSASGKCGIEGEGLSFAGSDIDLYTISHLDFGLQKARALILRKFEEAGKLETNPCINNGATVDIPLSFDKSNASLSLTGSGDYAACKTLIDDVFMQPALGDCKCNHCTYHGKAQPLAIDEYIALAFYRERTASIGMADSMTVADIEEKAKEVCGMSVADVNAKFTEVPNGVATDLCMDLAFISLHLQYGHGILPDGKTKLTVVDKIDDFELGWCLGAMQQTMAKLYSS